MQRMKRLAITALLLAAGSAQADTVVVTADHMIDVIAGRVVDHPQITITDGRISAVASQGAPAAAGARHIDLPGMTLLPGLIDMHVHLTSDPLFSGYRELEFTDNFWTVIGVANAKRTVEAGFTTVRNVGSSNYDDVALKQAINGGYIPGPRIVPATYAIGAHRRTLRRYGIPAFDQDTTDRCCRRPRGSARNGAQAAQIWRRGHQVLRHRRRAVEDRCGRGPTVRPG